MPDDYVAMLTDKVQEQLLQFANEEDFKQYLRFLPNMSQYSLVTIELLRIWVH